MKIILLQHLSGAESLEAGEEIEVSDNEALRFIKKGIAKAKTPKAHNDLMAKAEKLEREEADKIANIIAIQKEEELGSEAHALLDDLYAIVSTIATVNKNYPADFLKAVETKFKGK